jgi:hypothetical protein
MSPADQLKDRNGVQLTSGGECRVEARPDNSEDSLWLTEL